MHRASVDSDEMTMGKKSTYGLSLSQMANLFALGSGESHAADERCHDEDMHALLHEQMTSLAPQGSLLRETLSMLIDPARTHGTVLEGKSLAEILLSPRSDLALLQALKDAGKTLSCTLESQSETALARTIYFAAIASALVHHSAKITRMTDEALAESLVLLSEKPWMTPNLIELFSQARRICRPGSDAE